MNENIDLTKILKDCPKGTKLYSTIFGEVSFISSSHVGLKYPIVVKIGNSTEKSFTAEGKLYIDYSNSECVLFPSREQRDWSKFTASWYKKESDTISCLEEPGKKEYVLKSSKDEDVRKFMQYIEKQAKAYEFNLPNGSYDIYAFAKDLLVWLEKQGEQEEPQVYDTEDGEIITYSETDGYKVVEPKFHKGQWIACKGLNTALIIDIVDDKYEVEFFDGNKGFPYIDYVDRLFHIWTIQDVKDGEVLVDKCNNIGIFQECKGICWHSYIYLGCDDKLRGFSIGSSHEQTDTHPATKEQHDALMKAINNAGYKWNAKTKTLEELIKPKFDPNILQPFDRVLVRGSYVSMWRCNLFSHIIKNGDYPYQCSNRGYLYCIPYNDETKHLVGTTDEAPKYYNY